MALIRDAIRIDGWARAQHATHTAEVRPEWCPLCPTTTTLARPEECPDCHGTGRRCETCGHTPEPERTNGATRCHCGSGKLPGILRQHGWCCGECYNDRRQCDGPPKPEPPATAAPVSRPAKCQECGVYAATEQCAAVMCPQRSEPRMYPTAEAYIAGIRNAAKRAYAEAYARYMRHDGPEPERGALSYMAAQAVRMHLTSLGVTPPRPPRRRYRLTPEGLRPCAAILTPATPAPAVSTATIAPSSALLARANSETATRSKRGAVHVARPSSADAAPSPKRTAAERKRKRAGTYGQLLDRLEAIGATFCAECYGYFMPGHTEHSWHGIRGPVVAVAHCTLAEPVVVDGLDGQSELVTIQEREAA